MKVQRQREVALNGGGCVILVICPENVGTVSIGAAVRRHQGRPSADSDVAQRGRFSVQLGRPVRQADQRLHRVADGGDAVVAAFRPLHLLGPERRRKGGSFRCGHRPG